MRFFLGDASDLLADIRTTIANGDARALEFAAHRLKGLVSNFDAAEARQRALQLERMGRDVDLALAEATYRRLEGHVARLQQALEDFLSRQ